MKTIEFKLIRKKNFEKKCIGEMFHENIKLCDTLEPTSRNLTSEMSENYIHAHKKINETAIPTGRYKLKRMRSVLFKKDVIYLEYVKGFIFIMIHVGNTEKDTKGCILVGNKTKSNTLLNSFVTEAKIYDIMADYMTKGHVCFLTISEEF